jgi:hypothetical protein
MHGPACSRTRAAVRCSTRILPASSTPLLPSKVESKYRGEGPIGNSLLIAFFALSCFICLSVLEAKTPDAKAEFLSLCLQNHGRGKIQCSSCLWMFSCCRECKEIKSELAQGIASYVCVSLPSMLPLPPAEQLKVCDAR